MKRISIVAASLIVSVGVALGVVGVAHAEWSGSFKSSDETVTIAKEQTHKGALYTSANRVVVDGTVDGDVYCMTGDLVITGVVAGDILCMAQKVTVEDGGAVHGDVRVLSQYVNLNGNVDGSVSAVAQDVRVAKNTRIDGDLNGLSQMMMVGGTVRGAVAAAGQSLTLDGTVGGNADLAFESINLGASSRVAGDFNYTASRTADVDASRVGGEVHYNQPVRANSDNGWVGGLVILGIAMLLTALIVALVMPRFVHRSSELIRQSGLTTVLLGFAVALGGPLLIGMTMVTIFLAPVAIIMLLVWLLVTMLSGIFFAYYIGSVLLRAVDNIVLRMLGGAIVLLILYMIPLVQVFVIFAAWVVGSGMIVMTLTNGYRRPEYSLIPSAQPVASKAKTTRTGSTSKSKKN